ncbi:hypothetical protein [Streptomyces sp. SID3343]|uniref:hypothetical protein n=1 Tax=Streptomyces sp. SID3343 TaxID=2690260 RepID=UPI00137070D0|nr:hypothetical protein [Streptomyces sp. SID3343]MYW02619.1 hypothetical protein [Streptomyces sp. SID3343]
MRGRGNGLDAESFKPLTDLDPEAADVMLAALREVGVAAYVSTLEPREPDEEPEEIERLWVDAAATSRARAILRSLTEPSSPRARALEAAAGPTDVPKGEPKRSEPKEPPAEPTSASANPAATDDPERSDRSKQRPDHSDRSGSDPGARTEPADSAGRPDDDEVWAQIVASFDNEVTDAVPRWPVAEDLDGERGERGDGERGDRPGGSSDGSYKVGINTTPGPRDYSLAPPKTPDTPKTPEIDELEEDPDEHFVPAPPPPLPKTDAATKIAWIALVGGPLYLLVSVLLGRPVGPWTSFAAFAAFTGGFVALVARMRRDRDDDDPDDGAVV